MANRTVLKAVPVDDIVRVAGWNPRVVNEKSASFLELVESVKAQGVIVPIHVRVKDCKTELLAGERRLRAAEAAGVKKIPALDHGDISDAEAFEITFVENFARQDLTPLEQGRAARLMIERYDGDVTAAASKLGKSERWVRRRAAIDRSLIKGWKKVANDPDNDWTASHLQAISPLPADTQKDLLSELKYRNGRSTTVGRLEKKIAAMLQLVAKAAGESGGKNLSGSKPAKTLKERRKLLDNKRWNQVLIDLKRLIELKTVANLQLACPATGIMGMAAMWGNCAIEHDIEGDADEKIEYLTNADTAKARAAALDYLWDSVKPTLYEKIRNPFGVTQTPDQCIEFAKWIAPIVGVDIERLFAELCTQKGFTEPKSWAKLKADGTALKAGKIKKKKIKKQKKLSGKRSPELASGKGK